VTKIKIVRIVTASLVILAVVSGVVVADFRYGGICSVALRQIQSTAARQTWGAAAQQIWATAAERISATCPLGFLERSLASRELLPQWSFSVALVVLSVILLGRVFCAWVCPVVVLRRVFRSCPKITSRFSRVKGGSQTHVIFGRLLRGKGGLKSKGEAAPKEATWAAYSPYAVLGGVLVASFAFRFPVFCYFCPVGLFFGFLFAVLRPLSPGSLRPELVLFPAMLVLELWVLKSWCRSICPLGALLSIAGGLNRFLLPVVRKDKCLGSKGANCGVCERVCPEGIDLNHIGSAFSPNSCTKCLECYEECPARAVRIAIFR
jgi:ferredoxin-type protein NapH